MISPSSQQRTGFTWPESGNASIPAPPIKSFRASWISNQGKEPRRSAGSAFHLRQTHHQGGAGSRHLVEIGDVFQPPASGRKPHVMHLEVFRGAMVERERVDGQPGNVALFHQPLCCLDRKSWEM